MEFEVKYGGRFYFLFIIWFAQLYEPAAQEEYPELYYWAKLFLADTMVEIDMLSKHSEGIQEAIVTLKKLSADENIQLQCEAREMYDHDMASAIDCGRREGLKEGMERGTENGIHVNRLENARNMLQDNMDITLIMKYTGLSESQINDLKES